MQALELVKLGPLMERTTGRPEIVVALIDGPVMLDHPELDRKSIREVHGRLSAGCSHIRGAGCTHGTFIAGILSAKRGAPAPAICPACTLLVRPIFSEVPQAGEHGPTATPDELAEAIVDVVKAGARVVNMSVTLAEPSTRASGPLEAALNYAALRGVVVVAAAGNQGALASTALTRHPWVIPVTACDNFGQPIQSSNLSASVGKWGLCAPGEKVS